jgi:hypothetical protein
MCIAFIRAIMEAGRISETSVYFNESTLSVFQKALILTLIVYLTTLFRYLGLYVVEWKGGKWQMSWKGYEMSKSWPNLRHYPVIYLERLRITTKNLSIAGFRTDILTQTSRLRCRHGTQLTTTLHLVRDIQDCGMIQTQQ